MATVLLQVAGGAIGGILGGPFGAVLGRAIGGIAGHSIDQQLFSKDQVIHGPRLEDSRILASSENAVLPKCYGQVRVGGQIIWATRFREVVSTKKSGGGKGGGGGSKTKVKTYSYFASFAVALCDGQIADIRRVWADGKILDLTKIDTRLHKGELDQEVDPLIEAKQATGKTPAYRGTAYIVFDNIPLKNYGNRIPQITAEVLRPVSKLAERVESICVIPGSTEYGYGPGNTPQSASYSSNRPDRVNTIAASDWVTSIDELQATCKNLKSVSLVVTWFGDDLRAGECQLRPRVEFNEGPVWLVGGVERDMAHLVSRIGDDLAYGGTPSDETVILAIQDLKARGLKVVLYPFISMDIPTDNTLADPYGGIRQAAYPWRGRVTCFPAIGQTGSVDKSATAASQIGSFVGAAQPNQFSTDNQTVHYSGIPEWSFRRMMLHYAHLCASAGGVDGFIIGSEMRELSTVRGVANIFPFVSALEDLATDVRGVLGKKCKLTYAADWSEYFGYQPQDGSGDRYFHLDSLWSHHEIDCVGIDNYMPIADWREDGDPQRSAATTRSSKYLANAIASGEGYDWFYRSAEDRQIGVRTPIIDGENEPWIWRFKDIVSWWKEPHHERIGGNRQAKSTGWIPQSKPIEFTELGCAAIDKAANQPNVFLDAKSTESFTPYFSDGGRDDLIQNRFLQAHYDHWSADGAFFSEAENPQSSLYSGRMVDTASIALWTWDARPYPWFPELADLWGDGENWYRGHWLTGRLCGCPLNELIEQVLRDFGFDEFEVEADGWVDGFLVPQVQSGRSALEPLLSFFGVRVFEKEGVLHFSTKEYGDQFLIDEEFLVQEEGNSKFTKMHRHDLELPVQATATHSSIENGYESVSTITRRIEAPGTRQISMNLSAVMSPGSAEVTAEARLRDEWLGRETMSFAGGSATLAAEPGDLVSFPSMPGKVWQVENIETGIHRLFDVKRIEQFPLSAQKVRQTDRADDRAVVFGAPRIELLDLPKIPGQNQNQTVLHVAADASPWAKSYAILSSPNENDFTQRGLIELVASIGELANPLGIGCEGRWDKVNKISLEKGINDFSSSTNLQLLNGANLAAVKDPTGRWELVQFKTAELLADGSWELSTLLRGQLGSVDSAGIIKPAGSRFVLLDGSLAQIEMEGGERGLPLNWLIGPSDDAYGSVTYAQTGFTYKDRASLPFSPVHVRSKHISNGDRNITWIRRSRTDGDSWEGAEIPLAEENEAYAVSILNSAGTVLREKASSSPSVIYSIAEFEADFPTLPDSFVVTVAQLGSRAQRGIEARQTIKV